MSVKRGVAVLFVGVAVLLVVGVALFLVFPLPLVEPLVLPLVEPLVLPLAEPLVIPLTPSPPSPTHTTNESLPSSFNTRPANDTEKRCCNEVLEEKKERLSVATTSMSLRMSTRASFFPFPLSTRHAHATSRTRRRPGTTSDSCEGSMSRHACRSMFAASASFIVALMVVTMATILLLMTSMSERKGWFGSMFDSMRVKKREYLQMRYC